MHDARQHRRALDHRAQCHRLVRLVLGWDVGSEEQHQHDHERVLPAASTRTRRAWELGEIPLSEDLLAQRLLEKAVG